MKNKEIGRNLKKNIIKAIDYNGKISIGSTRIFILDCISVTCHPTNTNYPTSNPSGDI